MYGWVALLSRIYPLVRPQPDEQMWIDIGKLIREHLPDKNGNTLPADLTSGSYELRDLTHNAIGTLFEGKVTFDKTYGHTAYGCALCCGWIRTFLTDDPLGIPLAGGAQNGVEGDNSCGQLNQDLSGDFVANWSTANPAIAKVSSGYHTGVSVGSTTSSTFANLQAFVNRKCPITVQSPSGGDNVLKLTLSPTPLNMSAGDTNVTINLAISPSSFSVLPTFSTGLSSNPNSSSTATVNVTNPSSPVSGSYNGPIKVASTPPITQSPSGRFNILASASGVTSNIADLAVPPQILTQMIQAEAQGAGVTSMTAVGEVVRNRFSSSIFDPPYSTYQNAIPGQFATTSTTTGVEPELDIAASVFTGASAGTFCGSLAFWTPTSSQWSVVQNAISSKTSTFPAGTGAPTYSSVWPTSQQQILYVSSVGTQSNGAPNFLFLTQRSSTQAAAIGASCN